MILAAREHWDSLLRLESSDLLLQPPPRLRPRSLEVVLHRLQVAHEVGEMTALPVERRVILVEALLDGLW